MKATGILLLLLVWQTGFSQITDNFDDGDFTANPPWSGTTADFSVIDGALGLTAAAASGSSFLASPSTSINNASWQFTVKMAFNPSSSNYTEVYLVSDSSNFSAALSGYLVRIGWTTDNICLMRQDGTSLQMLIEGQVKKLDLSSVELSVKVSRFAAGEWRLWSKLASESDWQEEGSATDNIYVESSYFGFRCNYTATRSDKFSFDNITVTGEAYVDRYPPEVDTVYSISETALRVKLSEDIDPNTVALENFLLNGVAPVSVAVTGDLLELEFAIAHKVENILRLTALRDLANNSLETSVVQFVHYSFLPGQFGDIAFNEIMPDPTPKVDLAEVEYVEIINSSPRAILMTEWSLSDRATEVLLPDIKLKPDSLVILTAMEAIELFGIDNITGLDRWPSLNNADDELWLRDSAGNIIDYLDYNTSLYKDPAKEAGGWSLERMDPYLPCSGSVNWQASRHPFGGTPGRVNSVFQRLVDETPPVLQEVIALTEDSVVLHFSEPLGTLPSLILIPGVDIFNFDYLDQRSRVFLKTAPLEKGVVYDLQLTGIADCTGNITESLEATFVLPEEPQAGDLVLNEILFNPAGDYHDYLEVFNPSPRYISCFGMIISNSETEKTIKAHEIIEPGGYRVFSPEPEEITEIYVNAPEANILGQALPAFSNASGMAIIRDVNGLALDSIVYEESWHFGYLNYFDGIALERISPYRSGTEPSNWASASATHNYGTPGYENSQNSEQHASNQLAIHPQVIVPNADGRDDFTTITINNDQSALVTLRIYSLQGMEVRMLANNIMLSGTSYFRWDGTDEYGQAVPLGHYIVVADLIQENGWGQTIREKLVVGTGF
jgi:hypothetical protein